MWFSSFGKSFITFKFLSPHFSELDSVHPDLSYVDLFFSTGSTTYNRITAIKGALHNLNSEQSKKLQSQRELLRRKQSESAELDRKILDLADRINKKRMTQNQMHSGQLYTNVAPVKPVVKDNTLNQVEPYII